jgi:phosphate transport system permease protein
MDLFFRNLTRFFAFCVFSILAAILLSLLFHGQLALSKFGFKFLIDPEWNPVTQEFGALIPIYGTLASSAIALLIGIPVSFGIALFLTELSPTWLKRPLGTAIEMLAAIPSIIYGMWGLFVFAPVFAEYVQPPLIKYLGALPVIGALFKGPAMGIGMLTAGIVLAVMVAPLIISVMYEIFSTVPNDLRHASLAVGATQWQTIRNIVLPQVAPGIIAAIVLGASRALGETIAVLMVVGNVPQIPTSIFDSAYPLPALIANNYGEMMSIPLYDAALLSAALVLLVVILIFNILSMLVIQRMLRRKWAS